MGEARTDKAMVEPKSLASQVMLNLVYVSIWIGLSGTVILYNKWILAYYGFPYPIALTIWHMTFSSALAFAVVRLGYVEACNMSAETYVKAVVPIGACFAGTLWLGNAAYLYLSVSFIQMLKVGPSMLEQPYLPSCLHICTTAFCACACFVHVLMLTLHGQHIPLPYCIYALRCSCSVCKRCAAVLVCFTHIVDCLICLFLCTKLMFLCFVTYGALQLFAGTHACGCLHCRLRAGHRKL